MKTKKPTLTGLPVTIKRKSRARLKIGFFTDTYLPQVNGVVSSIESFRRELEKQGHKVYVYCPRANEKKDKENIIRFPSIKFFFQPEYHVSLPFTRHILKNYWHQDLDIIHAHTPFSLGLLGYYYAFIKKKPFIYTYHTLYPEYVKSYVLNGRLITPKMVERITASFSNRCDLNIAPSEKIRKLMKAYGVKEAIKVLATGIDLKHFKKAKGKNNFRKYYKIKPNELLLLYVGRLGSEKNINLIIRSIARIKAKGLKFKLVIVGDGPARENIKNLALSLGLKKDVIFTGYIKPVNIVRAYQAADLFVFASQTDTQGLVLLEAAACGLPILAVKDSAFTNVLKNGQNGLFASKNITDYSNKMWKLLKNDKLREKMGQKSYQFAQKLSIEHQTKKLLDMYYKLSK